MVGRLAEAQTIAVFTKNLANPNYVALRLGADRAAAAMGAKTYHRVPKKPDDAAEQIELLSALPQEKPDALIFNPADEKRLAEPFSKYVEPLGIPVINIVNRAAGYGDKIAFVGADDEAIGYETAQYLLKAMDGKGKLVILEGTPTAVTAVDRLHGFHRALKEYPGVTVVASVNGKYLRPEGLNAMKMLLAKDLQFDAILGANDLMVLGALDALDAAGRSSSRIKSVGINGIPEAIAAIESGRLLATEDYDGFKLGCISAMATIRHMRGLPVPRNINLPVAMIDKTNYAAWKIPLQDRQCPTWEQLVK
jgi:ribose transport system substrate-binding protein